jgi:hypothetical protein
LLKTAEGISKQEFYVLCCGFVRSKILYETENRKEYERNAENCIMKSSMICTTHLILLVGLNGRKLIG